GCIAVSGGLEVASDRLLELIQKGVTVAQVARVARNFTEAGIMVHAYLMYGFPTQTAQETIDSLEMVRQLFEIGVLQSGFWHQFAMTAHSPVGMHPEKFGAAKATESIGSFANNDIAHIDRTGTDHDQFSFGLKKSLFNFMHGICFDFPLQDWFEFKVPRTKVPRDFIFKAVNQDEGLSVKPSAKIVWIGNIPGLSYFSKSKKGISWEMASLSFHTNKESYSIQTGREQGIWLKDILAKVVASNLKTATFQEVKADYEKAGLEDFEIFWDSRAMKTLRKIGLLVL
ncbi:MAG TPA: radical SAM protein, partial [Flavobacterium sp.]|nr:radical SAM protein [Flavobacterium sp.]